MTLPEQLRAIADRLDAATAMRNEALDELAGLGADAVEIVAGTLWSGRSSIDAPGPSSPAAGTDGEGLLTGATSPPVRIQRAEVVQEAAVSQATAKARTPGHQFGDAGSTPALRSTCLDCDRPVQARGYCGTHYKRRWTAGTLPGGPSRQQAARSPGTRLATRDAKRAHPSPGRSVAPAAGVTRPPVLAEPVLRKGGESWVCGRCTDAFPSREKLDDHLVVAHPDVEPRRLAGGRDRILRGGAFIDQ